MFLGMIYNTGRMCSMNEPPCIELIDIGLYSFLMA